MKYNPPRVLRESEDKMIISGRRTEADSYGRYEKDLRTNRILR
jgi:hypothetical protein